MSNPFSPQKLIFDIETIGLKFETLDKISQEYLLQYAEDEEEEEEAKERLGFSPLTGEVAAIGILNPDTNNGAIYLRNDKLEKIGKLDDNIALEWGSEKQILEKFWEAAKHYSYFISFNGRSFDVPFLMVRSAVLGIKPTKNLLSNRYLNSQKYDALHVDLLDQLTFYGAVRRKYNLHFWAKAFGIQSPKEEGVTGYDVSRLYGEGKLLEIAKYNFDDLRTTKELYDKWQKYLNI